MADLIQSFNIKDLFSTDKYQIPIYQRNYAWRKIEISQLINDINDYVELNRKYYIGTLIVYEKHKDQESYYETIDGQQRLTTLSILLSVLKNEYGILFSQQENVLSFESRKMSQTALDLVSIGRFDGTMDYHNTIKEAYDHITNELNTKINDITRFTSYLLNKVTILRVEVPKDTELNHYFEIMNNRGEQLEKHEVLKSYLLGIIEESKLNESKKVLMQKLLNMIWEACSNMDRYIQFGFEPDLRKKLFGKNWTFLQYSSFDDLFEAYEDHESYKQDSSQNNTLEIGIDEILMMKSIEIPAKNNDDLSTRFHSVINFQNFLLHILKIQTQNIDYALDDKRLLLFFEEEIKKQNDNNKVIFVQDLIFNILKGKHMLDTFVIKRQYLASGDSWSLLKLRTKDGQKGYYKNTFRDRENPNNQIIIMLLSMFHVSTPTMIYKYWFNAALKFLMDYEDVSTVDHGEYQKFLEVFAKDLICFRFLNEDKRAKTAYDTIIYNPEQLPENYPIILKDNKLLRYGSIENNLLFNFLDYIIWMNDNEGIHNNFEFTFRSSVEHYYPQHPIGGEPLDNQDALHSFGNLCLISHQKNSKLNHHLPSAKKDYYAKLNSGRQLSYDSLKQYVMMNNYDETNWSEKDIFDHNEKMVKLLNKFINSE